MSTKIEHTPGYTDIRSAASVAQVERILSDWFSAEVILTSSGRAAILLYLKACGFNRYRDRIAVPRMISCCVLDAVIRCGFPADAASIRDADATLLYHQYGIPQSSDASDCALEDVCHAFFSSRDSGERDWKGEVAVFSLPKFFRVSEMCGGLIVTRGSRARQLRNMRNEAATAVPPASEQESSNFRVSVKECSRAAVEQFYLKRLLNPQIYDQQIGGVPTTIHEICEVGERRTEILLRLLEAIGAEALPPGWNKLLRDAVPFALPVFGGTANLLKLEAALAAIGIVAGIYQIDVARNMTGPRYKNAVLLPCHQEISSSKLCEMIDVLKVSRTRGDF